MFDPWDALKGQTCLILNKTWNTLYSCELKFLFLWIHKFSLSLSTMADGLRREINYLITYWSKFLTCRSRLSTWVKTQRVGQYYQHVGRALCNKFRLESLEMRYGIGSWCQGFEPRHTEFFALTFMNDQFFKYNKNWFVQIVGFILSLTQPKQILFYPMTPNAKYFSHNFVTIHQCIALFQSYCPLGYCVKTFTLN